MSLNIGILSSAKKSLLLLDLYPGAVAAYSLRKLRTDYTGAAIRVRESATNTEADIGFSGGVLDTAALAAHCGANDGFVTTWYDQAGSSNDAIQATAAQQPKIYDSSTGILTDGTNPVIKAPINQFLGAGNLPLGTIDAGMSIYMQMYVDNRGNLYDIASFGEGLGRFTIGSTAIDKLGVVVASVTNNGNFGQVNSTYTGIASHQLTIIADLPTIKQFRNDGIDDNTGAGYTRSNTGLRLFSTTGRPVYASLNEVILYTTVHSDAIRDGIEANINAYY